ncbi:MAG: hypothetical protein ACK5LY_01320 [Lachnospirales bacterium]
MKTTLDYENELIKSFIHYGVEIKDIEKKPKTNSYLFTADNKKLCIKKVYAKDNVIVTNYELQQNIKDIPELYIEKIEKTLTDDTFLKINDITYVTFNSIDSIELDFNIKEDAFLFFKTLQLKEKLFENMHLENEIFTHLIENRPLDLDISKNNDIIKQLHKNVQNQKKKSDFDFSFLKYFSQISETLLETESFLENNEFYKNRTYNIILNSTYIENFKGTPTIKTPYTFCYGSKYVDIYNFLYRYIKKTNTENLIPFDELISSYMKNMCEDEKKLIKYLLQYPFKYINIMVQYYDKKRNFVPREILFDLEEQKILNEKINNFIN